MKKLVLFSFLAFVFNFITNAQWLGPTNGVLFTGNTVRITQPLMVGLPGAPSPSLFQVQSTDQSVTTNILSATFDGLELKKPLFLLGTNVFGKRNNGSTSFNLMSYGNFTINTDGVVGSGRGLFINSDNRNFFSITEDAILFSDANQDLFKVNNNGELYTRKVMVTLTNPFPDYVFGKNYTLTPLSELEAFIKKYHHLPNIPSAAEVGQNNNQIELAEMQLKLLEKIEELTLYILQQQKEIDELKKQVSN